MASDTDLERNDESDLVLTWSGGWTLSYRILAVNVVTIVLIALAIIYLDAYRNRLEAERLRHVSQEASMGRHRHHWRCPLPSASRCSRLVAVERSRLRLYAEDGALALDSWRLTGPTYRLRDPATQSWNKDAARALDRALTRWSAGRPRGLRRARARPRLSVARGARRAAVGQYRHRVRQAPELTPVFSAAAPLDDGSTLFVTDNDRDFTRTVRKQRRSLARPWE